MPRPNKSGVSSDVYYRNDVARPAPLSKDAELELFARYRRRRTATLRDRIVRQYLYWPAQIACRYAGPRMSKAEAISAANFGLMLAIEDFDPSRGRRFTTHSFFAIRRTVLDALRDTYLIDPTPGISAARHVFNTSGKTAEDKTRLQAERRRVFDSVAKSVNVFGGGGMGGSTVSETPRFRNYRYNDPGLREEDKTFLREAALQQTDRNLIQPDCRENLDQQSAFALVREKLKKLDPLEQQVMRARYFSDPTSSFREIGETLKLKEDHVRYVHDRALKKLGKSVKKEL